MGSPALCEQCASQDIISEHLWKTIPPDQADVSEEVMWDLFHKRGIEISVENVNEICDREGIPAHVREGIRNILYRRSLNLTTDGIEALKSRQSCPLCRIKLFALTGGPLKWRKDGPLKEEWRDDRRGFILGPLGTRVVFLDDSPAIPWIPRAGMTVERSQINTARIREWLVSCETVHGDQCASQPLNIGCSSAGPGLKTFRLVDVVNRCVVETPVHREYFALSYVWGDVEQVRLLKANKHLLMRPGGIAGLSSRLPKTISDAIELVRLLGKQYLWVDSLCLVQDDDEDLADSISCMDLIYRGATATIIAASGHNADAGLPGVRPNSRHAVQVIEEIAPGVRMTVLRELDDFLKVSHYSTRGWTFQEQILSSRSLVFFDDRVYFRCRRCVWCEDNNDYTSPEKENQGKLWGSLIPTALDAEGFSGVDAYQTLLLYYSRRELSVSSDAINAFAGMLRFLSDRLQTSILEGLPTSSFDISILYYGSCLRRRPEFPSYSWAGWSGNIDWPLGWNYFGAVSSEKFNIHANTWLDTRTWIVWSTMTPDGTVQPLDLGPESATIADENRVGYRNRSHPLLARGRPRQRGMQMATKSRKYTLLQFSTMSLWLKLSHLLKRDTFKDIFPLLDRRGYTCGYMIPNNADLVSIGTQVEVILLSECDRLLWQSVEPDVKLDVSGDYPFYWVMIIAWEGDVAERRGLGIVYKDAEVWSYSPGPVWKEILLG